jgi:leader peptidase (prepilin peptidase)/N-methyltransferase
MMMAGTFLGWQAVCVAFLVSVLPALLIGIGQVILRGNQEMPFGPSLAFGVLLTLFGWQWIGPHVQFFFFNLPMLGLLFGGGAVVLVIASFMLRLLRGTS